MIFEKLADIILKRSKLIVALWIVILICAVPLAMKAGSVLDYSTDNMAGNGAESIQGANVMSEYFPSGSVDMTDAVLFVVLFSTPGGASYANPANTGGLYHELSSITTDYKDSNDDAKIAIFAPYGIFPDETATRGVAIYAIIYNSNFTADEISDDTPNLRNYINGIISENSTNIPGAQDVKTYVSGSPAITYDTSDTASHDVSKIDVFSVLMILVLVGLFFRSFVTSAMPPLTIGAAFGIALCLMFLIGSLMDIMYMTQMMLMVSMLGAGCDYCIFILARYREERVRNGASHEVAVRNAVTWAGESITTSGLSVVIGFGAMSICSFSMISSMGMMLAVGIVVALLAALTLITSILAIFGDKLFWPTRMDSLKDGGKADKGWFGKASRLGHRYFTKSANASIKYAKVIIVLAVLFTVPAAYMMATAHSSYDMIGAMSSGDAIDGLQEIEGYSNGGMISPNYAVFELNTTTDPLTGTLISLGTPIGTVVDNSRIIWNNQAYLDSFGANNISNTGTGLTPALYNSDSNVGEVWGIYQWKELADKAASDLGVLPGTMSQEDTLAVYEMVASELPASLGKQVLASLTSTDPTQNIVLGYEAMVSQTLGIPSYQAAYDDAALTEAMDYLVNYRLATSVGGVDDGSGTFDILFVKYTVITKDQAMSDRSMNTIKSIDGVVSKFASDNSDMVSAKWLTGSAVVMYEISEQVSSEFLKVEILAIVLIFILLFFVMKSYVTPIRSIVTILMSVVWTVAITHLIFGTIGGDGVIWMIPIILIVVCLGLGMDYDILLTTRIKENHLHKGMTNDEAITAAVTHSGSVITICGLIMGGAFGTLMLSSTTMLQEFGFALCFAIVIDALLVRTYVVPAAMHLLGEWNWKGPKFLHRKDKPLD